MNVFPNSNSNDKPAWHEGFLALLPTIDDQLRFAFRGMASERREDAIAECLAGAAVAYARLHEQGKAELAFATPLAQYAARQFRAGRRVGGQLNCDDVLSRHAQRHHGFGIERLDRRDPGGDWKEILVEDRRSTPAETAAARIDFADWLSQLPRRNRRVATMLAVGESTQDTARRFGLTAGRVSQLRNELRQNWMTFQNEATDAACEFAMAGC
jgi:hypothetical protein